MHGEDVVSDVEALQRLRSPEPKRAEWSWRFLSSRFGGKVAREAFEAFTAAAQELGSAGDVYDALLPGVGSVVARRRRRVELTSQSVRSARLLR